MNKEEKDLEEEKELEQEEQNAEGAAEETQEEQLSEVDELKVQLKEANDKFLRLYSEFDNFRRRTAKEKLDSQKSAGADIIVDILPILDDFDRAIANNDKVEDINAIKEGFGLIHHKAVKILEAKGVKPMDSKGETFDVDKHEALTQIPAPTEDQKGKVVDVIEKGYYINDKILRFAKVVVGQ